MSNDSQNEFISKAKMEIKSRKETEQRELKELKKEKEELNNAIKGYENYHANMDKFLENNAKNFNVSLEELPGYFKSNINDLYQEYVQVRKDAQQEIRALQNYIEHCDLEIKNNERTLKFYKSQYMDSDFFEECLPLVELCQEKIDIYNENKELTEKTIKKIEKIVKHLENWK